MESISPAVAAPKVTTFHETAPRIPASPTSVMSTIPSAEVSRDPSPHVLDSPHDGHRRTPLGPCNDNISPNYNCGAVSSRGASTDSKSNRLPPPLDAATVALPPTTATAAATVSKPKPVAVSSASNTSTSSAASIAGRGGASSAAGSGRYRHDPYASEPSSPNVMSLARSTSSTAKISAGGFTYQGPVRRPEMSAGPYSSAIHQAPQSHWLPPTPSSSFPPSLNVSGASLCSSRSDRGQRRGMQQYPSSSPATPASAPYSSFTLKSTFADGGMGADSSSLPPTVPPTSSASAASHSGHHAAQGSSASDVLPATPDQLLDLFSSMSGSLAAHAMTPRGRHILIAILRLGNAVVFERCLAELCPALPTLAVDAQGCHVVRHLVEVMPTSHLPTLVSYLSSSAVLCMATRSQHTRRALQSLFECHQSPVLDDIVAVIAADIWHLSTSQQGCITVMRCMEHTSPRQSEMLLEALFDNSATGADVAAEASNTRSNGLPPPRNFCQLAFDPYGNYVVQACIKSATPATLARIIDNHFRGSFLTLSTNKFGSNVVESVMRSIDALLAAEGIVPTRGSRGAPHTSVAACSADDDDAMYQTKGGRGGRGFSRGGGAAPMLSTAANSCPPASLSPAARQLILARRRMVAELCSTEGVNVLVYDGFGNFVLQAAIDTCLSPCEFQAVMTAVRPLLQLSPFGNKIDTRLRLCSRRWMPSASGAVAPTAL